MLVAAILWLRCRSDVNRHFNIAFNMFSIVYHAGGCHSLAPLPLRCYITSLFNTAFNMFNTFVDRLTIAMPVLTLERPPLVCLSVDMICVIKYKPSIPSSVFLLP